MAFMSKEAKVGIFVLIGIIILAYFTLKVGKIEVTERGYTIYAVFDTISGLDEKSVVKMAGVPIGTVEAISLEDGRAKVKLRIKEKEKIPADSTISLAAEGLLGESYIEIYPGKSRERFLQADDTFEKSLKGANLNEFIRQMTLVAEDFKEISESLVEALGDEEGRKSLSEIVANLSDSSRIFRDMMADNDEKIGRILDNLDRLSADLGEVTGERKEDLKTLIANLREFTDTLKERTPEIADKIENTMGAIDGFMADNKQDIREAIENIKSATAKLDATLGKIERGEGTIGKLVTDEKVYEDFSSAMEGVNRQIKKLEALQTYLDYRLEFQENSSEFKQYASIRIQPTVDKYYLFGIVDDPIGNVETTRTVVTQNPPGTTTDTERVEIDDDIKFNALYAKQFGDFTFRGGLMESTGGLGISYRTLADRLAFSFDLFDFDRGDNDPHLKLYGNYSIFKNLFITAGYDDFVNENRDLRNVFFGFGIELRDEDLKTLFRATPSVSP